MATILSVGDIAIVHYNSDTDTFSFVFLRDVDAGTVVNFTDNGWLAGGGFRSGEGTVTYTAPAVVTAGTVVTLTGLNIALAGDQIIAFQGDPATPTILHLVDFGDGDNAVGGDAIDAQTTALPPGFALGVNAVAIAFDHSLYAGPTNGSPAELFAASNNTANWIDSSSLPIVFNSDARPSIDLDRDDSTHGGRDYETSVASGGPGVAVTDIDIVIGDDGADIFAAEIKITGAGPGDLLVINGALPPGITATAYDPATGVLRLDGQAPFADYEVAIRLVEFSTADAANTLKRIEVIVFDGAEWSEEGTAFIHVSQSGVDPRAAPPALDLDANNSNGGGADYTATYATGGPGTPIADVDVTITDADSATIASATITILNWNQPSGDTLSISGSLPAGIVASAYDPIGLSITLSGVASLADYQAALQQVVFSSTNPAPGTGDRGIQVVVNDGGVNSNIATTYMHVVAAAPNMPPVLDLDADDSTTDTVEYLTTFVPGGPPVAVADTDVLITDTDSTQIISAAIRLTEPDPGDVLVVNGTLPAGITASAYDSVTGLLMLSGAASLADYQTALRQVAFDNATPTPSTFTRVVNVTVSDAIGSTSNVAHAIIEVEQINAAPPVVDLDADDSTVPGNAYHTTFTENGAPVAVADTDTLITDVDSTGLASATVTLINTQTGDLLAISGALPAGITASAYDPVTGILTLTGNASLADYQAALEAIRFSAAGDHPVAGTRIIQVVVNDGANDSQATVALVTVLTDNDAPTLNVAPSASYVENAAPLTLSPTVTLTDPDNAELTLAVVTITDGSFAGDGDILTVAGTTSGTVNGITFLWNEAAHALVFSGAGLVADYQALLQMVAFQSASNNPTDYNASPARTLTWAVSDGETVTTAATTLDIVAENDAPLLTVAPAATYTENGAPVVISPAATTVDVDDLNLVAGAVRIASGAVDGDILTVNGQQSGTFSDVDFSYNAALHVLIFGHTTSVTDFQTFLQAVAFQSTGDDPTDGGLSLTRTLTWAVFDGDNLSTLQTTILSITAENDAPVNTVPGAQSVNEDTALAIAGLSIADTDSATLTTTLTVASGTLSIVSGTASVTGNLTGTVTISGTIAEVNAALAGMNYLGNPNFTGADTLTMTTSDGLLSDIDTVGITVAPVADAPQIDLDSDNSSGAPGSGYITAFIEHGLPALLAGADMTLTDADDANLVGATFFLLNSKPDDALLVTGALPPGITATVIGNQLTLSGSASVADYQAAIRLVAFDNPSDTLDLQSRVVLVQVNDGDATASAFVLVQIVPVNETPVAQNGSASGDEDKPITGMLIATDSDTPALTYALVTQAAHGSVVLGQDGSYSYTPAADFNGSDSFTFVANDGAIDSNIATVTLTVKPVDDRPPGQGPGGVPLPDPVGFDAPFYLAANPDVAATGVDPLEHFNTVGWREGRNPSAYFDTTYYLAQNPDVAVAGVNPLDHFNTFGWREGRDPNAYFDTSGYLEHYPDVAATGVNPLEHFEEFGWHEGRDPSLAFDTTQYLAVYTDVAAAHTDPLGHFLYFGIHEGRSPFGDGYWE